MEQPAEIVTLSPKQANIFVHGFQPYARHRIAVCGRRFGKTYLAIREIKRAAIRAAKLNVHVDAQIWYGAPTYKNAKNNFWDRLKRTFPPHWLDGKPNASELSLRLQGGRKIRLVGLDNHDDLRGAGLFFFLGDEWSDAKPEAWSQTIFPMLSSYDGNSLRIGTPKGYNHFYDDYIAGQPGGKHDYKSWSYTTSQGGMVSQEKIDIARSQLDPLTFRQEYEATFETYAGQVLYSFNRKTNVRPCPYDATKPVHIGMDFNINPMSATVWQEDGDISSQIGEIILLTSDTDAMSKEIIRRYSRNGSVAHITVYPDPAGAQSRTSAQGRTDISILRGYGFRVLAMSSHPLVRDRLSVTNARFTSATGEHRAFVDPSCVKSIEAYEKHKYRDGSNEPDKTSGYDHPVDATGYYMFVRFPPENGMKMVKLTGF